MTKDIDEAVAAMSRRRAGIVTEPELAEARTPAERIGRLRAFGRDLSEADVDASLQDVGQPTTEEFRAVGLTEADASSAARGLLEGTYLSFEDACLSKSIFSTDSRISLNRDLMQETAKRFADGRTVQS